MLMNNKKRSPYFLPKNMIEWIAFFYCGKKYGTELLDLITYKGIKVKMKNVR